MDTKNPTPKLFNLAGAPAKFEVMRLPARQVEKLGESENVFRAYKVLGVKTERWNTATPKVSSLALSSSVTLIIRITAEDKAVVDARLEIGDLGRERLDAAGKTTYHHVFTDGGGHSWGVVHIPLAGPEEDAEVRSLAAYPLRLASWATKRLKVNLAAWAEERL
jgi:hypothetical protein